MVRLMSVAGFTIDRSQDSATATIRGNDSCAHPDDNSENGGVVYKFRNGNMNDSCVCTTQAEALKAYGTGPTATYLKSSSKWRTDSTDYCESSPFQGLSSIDCDKGDRSGYCAD